ncbi:hypothetical protein U1Q18_046696 [Sarracenia purpurea var. burkii]
MPDRRVGGWGLACVGGGRLPATSLGRPARWPTPPQAVEEAPLVMEEAVAEDSSADRVPAVINEPEPRVMEPEPPVIEPEPGVEVPPAVDPDPGGVQGVNDFEDREATEVIQYAIRNPLTHGMVGARALEGALSNWSVA